MKQRKGKQSWQRKKIQSTLLFQAFTGKGWIIAAVFFHPIGMFLSLFIFQFIFFLLDLFPPFISSFTLFLGQTVTTLVSLLCRGLLLYNMVACGAYLFRLLVLCNLFTQRKIAIFFLKVGTPVGCVLSLLVVLNIHFHF